EREQPFVIIFTKADKLSKRQREERMAGFAQEIPYFDSIETIEFSAVTGEGVDKIRAVIEEATVFENE
ncbi:MAG: YihA family ribosome biogenesis GTP-binding protein, partial [Oscillospiraceae bacterium]|nr:YihA family ribosome biogenesis GTP-binding protein [Oscillospiraceae bacterium]